MKTVKTAVQILTMFSDQTPAITVTSAANHFGLTPSASSRLLSSLASTGIIQREPDRSYRPGPLAYRLGLLYYAHNRLADIMNDGARRVVARTGMTCWVSVLSGADCMLLSRFPGPHDHGFHVNAGYLLPANASAGGKALLARLSDAELKKFLDPAKLNAWTERSKIDIEVLCADLEQIRQRSWSLCAGELFLDTMSVGVAFSTSLEPASMALSISVPRLNIDALARGVHVLVDIAHEIGETTGDSYWIGRTAADVDSILVDIKDYIRTYKD